MSAPAIENQPSDDNLDGIQATQVLTICLSQAIGSDMLSEFLTLYQRGLENGESVVVAAEKAQKGLGFPS